MIIFSNLQVFYALERAQCVLAHSVKYSGAGHQFKSSRDAKGPMAPSDIFSSMLAHDCCGLVGVRKASVLLRVHEFSIRY